MARRTRNRADRRDPRADNRMARVGELIRRILAESLEALDDHRLDMVSITGVDVDRELNRAVVWFTTLDGEDDAAALEALDESRGRLRRAVGDEARLRKIPELRFRPDTALRAAERIEGLIRDLDTGRSDPQDD